MSSIGIATLGYFEQSSISEGNVAGGIIHVPEEKPKPKVKLIKITTDEQTSKRSIEVKSVR